MIVRRSAWYLSACLLVSMFPLAWPSSMCRAERHTQISAALPTLPMMDAKGASMLGIVCDNLPDMPDALRNRLFLHLPETLRNVPLVCTLTNADSKDNFKTAKKAHPAPVNNVGIIHQEAERLVYTPPDEFNSNPEPQHLSDVNRSPRRNVLLTVRRMDADGAVVVAQQTIVLARPPVVAIHGINSSVESPTWSGKDRLISRLQNTGFTVVRVNHGKDDFNHRDPLAAGLEFHGNGPIEEGAQQVDAAVTQTLQSTRQTDHLAIRRVDLLGYSYGGLIARWYLHRFHSDPRADNSVQWYVRSANTGATHPLYRLDPAWYAEQGRKGEKEKRRKGEEDGGPSTIHYPLSTQDASFAPPPVRKLITVGSMWRGVPLCNYVNEIHAPETGGIRLADAPLLGFHIGEFVDGDLAPYLPTRVPAMEVMAVNSPWLTTLNNFVKGNQREPFVETIAYGSVAGDDNAFLSLPGAGARLDPYGILRLAQAPTWFPYLALERHAGSEHNYSDGLVPLWSAVIADNFDHFRPSRIVSANHDSILSNRQTLEYVACAFNNRAWLPSGQQLNVRWGQAITSRELSPFPDAASPQNSPIPDYALGSPQMLLLPPAPLYAWTFYVDEMAPHLQNQLYPQIRLLGRVAADALREIRQVQIEKVTKDSVILSWQTAAELNGFVTITRWEQVNFGAYDSVEVDCRIEPIGSRVTRVHRFRLSNLQPNTTYQVIANSEANADPDNIISVQSEAIRFTTKF